MDCRALRFEQLPHQPKLFLEYLAHFDRVASFYAHPPTMESVERVAKTIHYPAERRKAVVAILREQNALYGAGAATLQNLERLERGAIAIVSGQQVGLFGGPAYSIYKALTAVQIAQELTASGIEAVPVFWTATEDHDLEEVRFTNWFDGGKLIRLELPLGQEVGRPVGNIPLGNSVEPIAQQAAEFLTMQGSEVLAQQLRESYWADETYGGAFAKLFARLLAQQGLILLNPLDGRLHRVAAPVYRQAAEEREPLTETLLQRGKDLEQAGFAAQVKVTAKSTLLFHMGDDGPRQVITANGGKFEAGEKSWPREELARLAESEPQHFSPNALLRPVVQDYLLPTAAYVGGPTEICYFAQSEVIYRRILGRMPVMLPRAGFTLIDAKAAKLLNRYRLSVEDVWAGSQELRRKMEVESVPEALSQSLERDQRQIEELIERLGEQISKLDPTLKGAVETARNKISYQLDNLCRKAGRAYDERTGLIATHQEYLESLLYPNKTLQSRELCLLPFLARMGDAGLMELQQLCSGKKLGHHFIVSLQ